MACSVKCQSAPGSLCGQLVAFGVRCCVANELLVASAPGSLRGQLVACGRERGKRTWAPAWAAGGLQCKVLKRTWVPVWAAGGLRSKVLCCK